MDHLYSKKRVSFFEKEKSLSPNGVKVGEGGRNDWIILYTTSFLISGLEGNGFRCFSLGFEALTGAFTPQRLIHDVQWYKPELDVFGASYYRASIGNLPTTPDSEELNLIAGA
ncbi:hypothetical protein Tco_0990289 [Tanacetum coccineum]|uniref:Uncharacterized protein n=1 Tax=Tanacetum coccineum TaxID=301880 RepID=A0ABQ5EWB5_9ASTR